MILRCHDRICRSNRSVFFIIHTEMMAIQSLRGINELNLIIKINAISRRVCHVIKNGKPSVSYLELTLCSH